jgi:hypothetical protein
MNDATSHKAASLMRDFKYFFLILLTFWAIAVFWIPIGILSLFLGERIPRRFVNFFNLFD